MITFQITIVVRNGERNYKVTTDSYREYCSGVVGFGESLYYAVSDFFENIRDYVDPEDRGDWDDLQKDISQNNYEFKEQAIVKNV